MLGNPVWQPLRHSVERIPSRDIYANNPQVVQASTLMHTFGFYRIDNFLFGGVFGEVRGRAW